MNKNKDELMHIHLHYPSFAEEISFILTLIEMGYRLKSILPEYGQPYRQDIEQILPFSSAILGSFHQENENILIRTSNILNMKC